MTLFPAAFSSAVLQFIFAAIHLRHCQLENFRIQNLQFQMDVLYIARTHTVPSRRGITGPLLIYELWSFLSKTWTVAVLVSKSSSI